MRFITAARVAFVACFTYMAWGERANIGRIYNEDGLLMVPLLFLPLALISFGVAFGVAMITHSLSAASDDPGAGPGRHGDGGGGY